MTQIDPEQERVRLGKFYAGQTDGELENVAGQGSQLTEVAREALRWELSRRGLYIGQLEEEPLPTEPDTAEFRNLVTVRSFWNMPEADLAKGLLEASGIDSFLFDENMGRLYFVNVVRGVRLCVDAENAKEATRILDENVSEASGLGDDASDDPRILDPDPST
jgi:Putative prokaryotic signal transducing protein